MKPFYLQLKNWPPTLQVWFRPMLLISLGFHALLLTLPMPQQPKSEALPPKKAEKVKITTLLAPASAPSPKASPKPSLNALQPTPKPTPKRVIPPPQQRVISPPPVPIPKQTPKPEPPKEDEQPTKPPKQEEQPKKQPKEEEQSKQQQEPDNQPQKQPKEGEQSKQQQEPDNQPQKQPKEEEQPKQQQEFDNQPEKQPKEDNSAAVAEAGQGLLEELRPRILDRLAQSTNDPDAMREYLDTLPYDFIKPEQQPYFFEGEGKLKKGALAFLAIPQTNPQGAYEDYFKPVLGEELGFKVESLGQAYGQADLYKAHNEAQVEFYMSIVKPTGSGAFVVIWPKDPRS
jgi:hypothetical protein